jgi:hypothetical protein
MFFVILQVLDVNTTNLPENNTYQFFTQFLQFTFLVFFQDLDLMVLEDPTSRYNPKHFFSICVSEDFFSDFSDVWQA